MYSHHSKHYPVLPFLLHLHKFPGLFISSLVYCKYYVSRMGSSMTADNILVYLVLRRVLNCGMNACLPSHTTFPKSFNNFFVEQLISDIFREKELLQSQSFLKYINNHTFAPFIIVQIVTEAWFVGHRSPCEMCLFSSTPVSILCAHLRTEFGHLWLVYYNKHMGKMAENAQILKPYVTAWETMPY